MDYATSGFMLIIGPVILGFLCWCLYKVQNDTSLTMPAKMSLDVLESEKPPGDWENLDDFPATEEDEEDEEGAESPEAEDCSDKPCCDGDKKAKDAEEEEEEDDDSLKIKLGVGPQGVKGRPNQGRPDPRTMKLMLLESIRDKISRLEDQKDDMDSEKYEKQMANLQKAKTNAEGMPTDPKLIEKNMEKKALENARNTARQQLGHIAKAKVELMKARAENRVPDQVFDMNLKRMEAAEARFKKMLSCSDEEFLQIIKAENKRMGPNGPQGGPQGPTGPRPPMSPEQEKAMEKRAMADARKTAKDQLEQIGKARASLLQAKEAGRVPDNVFQMNMQRMQAGETQFKKMLDSDDEELIEIMKQMQQKAMQMQRMQRQMQMKKQQEMAKAKQAQQNSSRIEEVEEECEEIDMDQHEKKNESATRLRKNVASK